MYFSPRFESPNIAKECSVREDEMQKQASEFEDAFDFELQLNHLQILTHPDKWVIDEVADPAEELAAVYKQIAVYWNEPEKIGQSVRNILDNKIRQIAERKTAINLFEASKRK